MSVLRSYVLSHSGFHIKELDQRGILKETSAFCRSCGKVFGQEPIYSKYRSNGDKGQGTVKRHIICAIFHHLLTVDEAEKYLDGNACLVPALVKKQEKKLADERRQMFNIKIGAIALTWMFLIVGALSQINA